MGSPEPAAAPATEVHKVKKMKKKVKKIKKQDEKKEDEEEPKEPEKVDDEVVVVEPVVDDNVDVDDTLTDV